MYLFFYRLYGQPYNSLFNGIQIGYGFIDVEMPEQPQEKKIKGNRLPNKMSSAGLKNLPNGWHADGGDLYLFVRGTARSWVFRYTSPADNKRRNMGLGSLEAVTQARARALAREYRAMVKDPQNPIDPLK